MGSIRTTTEKFTLVHNDYLRDSALNYAEIGMLTVMLSLPDNWDFSIEGLVHRHGKTVKAPDGKYKIAAALKGLSDKGYFHRVRMTDEKGRFTGYSYKALDNLKETSSGYTKNFTVLGNSYLRDPELSIEMIGLLTVMLSLPDNWDFSIEGLVHRHGKAVKAPDGEFKTRSLLRKLNKAGYFRRVRLTDEKGKVVDWIYDFSSEKQEDWLNNSNTATETVSSGDTISVSEAFKADALPEIPESVSVNEAADDPIAEKIKENINYNELCRNYSAIAVDTIIKVMSTALNSGKPYRINRQKLSSKEIREFIFRMSYKEVSNCIENLKYAHDIKYPVPYILTALHNSLYAETGSNRLSFSNIREIFKSAKQQGTSMLDSNSEDSIMSIIQQYADTSLIGGEI